VCPDFYHLDTAICVLGPDTCMAFMGAFDEEGKALVRAMFAQVLEVTREEAMQFACNACSVDGETVFIQRGISRVNQELIGLGFKVREFDTSEYMKSGGSVFCMKMQLWH
jgi:N-dimethylarginine dimethylaminohydrolase